MTGQHLLLLLWTLWLVFALLSIGDLLGVILALVFGLLGAGLVLTGLASWRGYVIAWLIVHVLAAAYRVAVLREWLPEALASGPDGPSVTEQPHSVRRRLQTLSGWAQSSLLQTIFGSVSFVGLVSVLYLRPTVPWKYHVDIPLMILVIFAVVAAEYAFLPVSWRFRHPVRAEPVPLSAPVDEDPGADLTPTNGDTMEGKVVRWRRRPPADAEETNSKRIDKLEVRLTNVEGFLLYQQAERAQDGDAHAPSALESEPPMWFDASDPVRSWAESDELASGGVRVELLKIARLTARQEGSNATAGRVVGIIIERGMVPISLVPNETVSQVTTKAAETLSQVMGTCAAAPGTAQAIRPPDWGVVSERWVKVGSAGVNAAARTVNDFGADLDRVLHNRPVQRVFSWDAPGSPGSAAAVIGRDAETKQILEVGGIVVGTMSGQPVLVRACFKSLARDDFTRRLAAGLARELGTHELSSAPSSTPRLVG